MSFFGNRKKRSDAGIRRKEQVDEDVMISFRLHTERDADVIKLYSDLRDQGYSKREIFVNALLEASGSPNQPMRNSDLDADDVVKRLNTLFEQMQLLIGERYDDLKGAENKPNSKIGRKQREFIQNMMGGFNDDLNDEEIEE